MKKTLVIYKTKYGAAKKYAEWISEDLGCDLKDFDKMKKKDLEDYDVIVYGGGVHAGGIRGMDVYMKWLRKYLFLVDNPKKTFIFFACGINVQNFDARAELRNVNFSKKWLRGLTCYYFDGAYDPKLIKGIDKKIMSWARNMLANKGDLNMTAEDKELLNKMDNGYSNIDRTQIEPLVTYVKAL